jgi:hypothetical protein
MISPGRKIAGAEAAEPTRNSRRFTRASNSTSPELWATARNDQPRRGAYSKTVGASMVGKPPKVHMNDHAATIEEAKAQFEAARRQWLAWAKLDEQWGSAQPQRSPVNSRPLCPAVA